jgi:small-conductance mechanosensitive channel
MWWAQIAVVVACLALAYGLTHLFFRRDPTMPRTAWSSQRAIDSMAFPVLSLLFVLTAAWLLRDVLTLKITTWLLPALASLVAVRILARSLRALFPASSWARSMEKTFSWLVWGALALWITGALPVMLQEADQIKWQMGGAPVSLRSLLEAAVSGVVVMVAALWASSVIEDRLLARADARSMSVRKMAAHGTRALLLLVGLLLALTAAGIPVGALGVFGGALGVGIGLGLQKLAANYVSGFVILAERRLRIGDWVRVDGFEGRISDIATRYTVVRAHDGRESIVPNEMLMTQRVENHTQASRHVPLASSITVERSTDVAALSAAIESAVAAAHSRIVAQPACQVRLHELTEKGVVLTVQCWVDGEGPVTDIEAVRHDVNRAVLSALRSHGLAG